MTYQPTSSAPALPAPTLFQRTDVTRRRFLQGTAMGAGGLLGVPMLDQLRAHAAPALTARDPILVLVELDGGNDGLNTVCPTGLGRYYDLRPTLAIPEGQALRIDDNCGFHPALTTLHQRYRRGKVAVFQGAGYDPPDFSHFTSMALVQQAWGGRGLGPATGWLGRYADGLRNSASESLYTVSMNSDTPLALVGAKNRPSGLPMWLGGAFGVDRRDGSNRRLFDGVATYADGATGLGRWGDSVAHVQQSLIGMAQRIEPAYADEGLPDEWFDRQMVLSARLLNLNLGIRVVHTGLGGFDTHTGQATAHADLMTELDRGIDAFFRTLTRQWRRQVVMVVFSEFGRRPEENGDRGTDHGSSAPWLVIGDAINGGVYGDQPRLAESRLVHWGNLAVTMDYRTILATILRRWMNADAAEILGRRYENHTSLFRYTL